MYPSDIFFNSTLSLFCVIAISGIKITFKGFEEAITTFFTDECFCIKKKDKVKQTKPFKQTSIEELFLTAF